MSHEVRDIDSEWWNAVESGDLAQRLILAGADVDVRDDCGETAIGRLAYDLESDEPVREPMSQMRNASHRWISSRIRNRSDCSTS